MLEDPHARNRGPRRGKHVFFAYISVVIALGWTLIGWAFTRLSWADFTAMGAAFALMGTFVLLAELRPLLVAGSPDSNGVTITTCFVFAMLFHWGLPVAILLQTAATLVGDRAQRRVWWRMAFNTAQYAVSWAAAGHRAVAGRSPRRTPPPGRAAGRRRLGHRRRRPGVLHRQRHRRRRGHRAAHQLRA